MFAGNEPDIGHELAGIVEAHEVLQLSHERDGGDQLDAAHGLLQPLDASARLGDRVQILLKADLLSGMLHLHSRQPAQVSGSPRGLTGIADAVAQQQRLQAVACIALFAHRILAGTHHVAHGFIGGTRHAHHGKVVGAGQPSQLHGVAPIGFDALA